MTMMMHQMVMYSNCATRPCVSQTACELASAPILARSNDDTHLLYEIQPQDKDECSHDAHGKISGAHQHLVPHDLAGELTQSPPAQQSTPRSSREQARSPRSSLSHRPCRIAPSSRSRGSWGPFRACQRGRSRCRARRVRGPCRRCPRLLRCREL